MDNLVFGFDLVSDDSALRQLQRGLETMYKGEVKWRVFS